MKGKNSKANPQAQMAVRCSVWLDHVLISNSSIRHVVELKARLAQRQEIICAILIELTPQRGQVRSRRVKYVPSQVPTSNTETLRKLLALARTDRTENTSDDRRAVRDSAILLLGIAKGRDESLRERSNPNNLSVASHDV